MAGFLAKILAPTLILLVFAVGAYEYGAHHPFTAPEVYYSLDGKDNDQHIIDVIDGARSYVYFAIYEFTKQDIADALVSAKEKGIDVQGIVDRDNATTPEEAPIIAELEKANIPIETQKHESGIMHIKAVVTDKAYASGSYNWTQSATDENDEILEVGTDETTRQAYEDIIKKLLATNAGSTSTTAVASTPISIDYTQAPDHVGALATVTGTVVDVYGASNGETFFDYCKDYKNCPFSAVVFAEDAGAFPDLSSYEGKTVAVTGTIKTYGGTAEIVLDSPSEIAIIK